AGSCNYFKFNIHSVGDLMAYNLLAKNINANLTTGDQSPGTARIHVADSLEVTIVGPRHLYYKGNPKIINEQIRGSGKLKRK
ncbi:MAG: DUF2807 domain-containing protein, partial [Cyclobacteriaceae bacterium]